MSLGLFHQVGHNSNWNIESLKSDRCGDGLILSPVNQAMRTIEKLEGGTKQKSFFDPQFYLPSSKKSKLTTYPFFPETIAEGFATSDFLSLADESARQCVAFQIEQCFRAVIIPARFYSQMYPDYTDRQDVMTVKPFIKAIKKYKTRPPVYLTLPVTSHMVEHETYRTQLLNWVTSFPEVDGVYVIFNHVRGTKQIQDASFLISLLNFLREMQKADLKLLVGCLNTESLLLSLLGDIDVTFGTFENTRMFSIDKYVNSDEDKRGPRPRIYLDGLLNWIRFDQALIIKKSAPKLWGRIYKPTAYSEHVFASAVEPHFSQPHLYKHHLVTLAAQFDELKDINATDGIYAKLSLWLANAKANYAEIAALPVELDAHGGGGHVGPWMQAIQTYYRSQG